MAASLPIVILGVSHAVCPKPGIIPKSHAKTMLAIILIAHAIHAPRAGRNDSLFAIYSA
jgi:hypothetical protein